MPPRQFITRPTAELFGAHLGYGFAGLKVNTAIGNFTQTISDLTFPGNLLGLHGVYIRGPRRRDSGLGSVHDGDFWRETQHTEPARIDCAQPRV